MFTNPESSFEHEYSTAALVSTQAGTILKSTGELQRVSYSQTEGLAIFEGDIVIGNSDATGNFNPELRAAYALSVTANSESVEERAQRGMILVGEQFWWREGILPFEIDPLFPQTERVTAAIGEWQQNTPIRLIPRTEANAVNYPDYIVFSLSSACWSHIGRIGGRQEVGLSAGCTVGNIAHEIGHAVGLWHEQSRSDRDQHITIIYENIESGMEHNFDQQIADGDDVGPYDFDSIMHYPCIAFSRNGKPTIIPRNSEPIGQRLRLSDGDIAAVRALYPKL